ncbi:autotransporter outer membrane beta-barrel domain-containing protein [Pseudomonas sp. RA_35y_Pfl2_P32]|uniref:autotransporter outer membrane beta-barrel domain-containing protein n=1 Tax=Pseudomonas sp. RA_35y_Pfl2_P32 TaxID=3088705 RepID=UPI0030DA5865
MKKSSSFTRLFAPVRLLPLLTLSPAMLISPSIMALTIVGPGETRTIDASTPVDNYVVNGGGVLNTNGAQTSEVSVMAGSTINAVGGAFTGSNGNSGISVTNSQATLSGVTVTSTGIGMQFNREGATTTGSNGVVSNSTVSGGTTGLQITGLSTLELNGSQVTGNLANSVGINFFGGDVRATGSTISGGENGARMLADGAGLEGHQLLLDSSTLQGRTGSSILVDEGIDANITVRNNSNLLAGNKILLDVQGASTAAMTVATSTLTGNINVVGNSTANLTFDQGNMTGDMLIETGSIANLTLQNGSQFSGRLDKVNGLTINSGSTVTLTGNDSIGTLAMGGGNLKFGRDDQPDTFYRLNVGTLAGAGSDNLIVMKGDFANGQHDFLNVTGVATGDFGLAVRASGLDAASPQELALVRTGSGPAQFSLVGGPVALGAWSYQLASRNEGEATEWYLDPTTKTVSPGARSVLALFNAPATILYGESATLRSRMGELRFNGGDTGLWMRTYGNKYNIADGSGMAYKQTQQGLSLGADMRLGDSQWLAGVMTGYSHSDLNIEQGTSGTIKSYYLGPYVTWLDDQSGYYFDALLKFNRFHNDAKVGMSDGTRSKGDYTSNGVSASAEFGRHIKLEQDYFIEPYGKLTTAVIEGKSYELDNGMQADGDRTRSVLAEAGMTAGRNFALGNGRVAQPYVRAAVLHEFINNNRVTVNQDNVFNNDLSGSRAQLGLGVALALSKEFQVHADFDYAKGEHIEQPYGVNLGLRYSF